MKLFIVLFLTLTFLTNIYSQQSQDSLKLREGTTWAIKTYNKMQIPQYLLNILVTDIDTVESKRIYHLNYKLERYRTSGRSKTVYETTDDFTVSMNTFQMCAGSYFFYRITDNVKLSYIPSETIDPGYKFPMNLKKGDSLEDSKAYEYTVSGGGRGSYNNFDSYEYQKTFKHTLIDRKVVAKDTLKTAAGSVGAYIIEQDILYEATRSFSSQSWKNKVWYVPGFGIVRSEFYKDRLLNPSADKLWYYYELCCYEY